MTTFQEFIARHPDLTPFARVTFKLINEQAEKAGAQLAVIGDIARLLAADQSLSLSLRHTNQIMADALERDPSGRLAAIPSLRAWAERPGGMGNTWINWWSNLYREYLDHLKQPVVEAAE